jgi:soluble lytic murein transglycosylase-like protein
MVLMNKRVFSVAFTVTAFILLMATFPALADIFLYVDKEGTMHFTNVPTQHNYRLFLREKSSRKTETSKRYKPDSKQYDHIIEASSRRYGVDSALVKAIIRAESGFDPTAISTKGAEGLMQLMPETSRNLAVLNPFDPKENIEAGVKYLKYLLDRFDSDLRLSLAAYNAGETTVAQVRGVPNYSETKNYLDEVLRYYTEYQNNSSKRKSPR